MSEFIIAIEQAAEHIEDRDYSEWSRSAYIALAAAHNGDKTIKDLIGESPYDKRQRLKREAEETEEKLRQIALDKGLDPKF